nr:lipid II flippase MurJ [uncultured Gellertiella sp.]
MLRSANTVMMLNLLAQVVGFFRTFVIAGALGVSVTVDGYYLGLVVPTFLSTIFLGWTQVSFVGKYTAHLASGDNRLANLFFSRFFWFQALISLACSLACYLFPDLIASLLIKDSQQSLITAAAAAVQVAGWIIFPLVTGDFLGLALNAHGRFFIAALAPLANAAVSVLLLWIWPQKDLFALNATLLAGTLVQFGVMAVGVAAIRIRLYVRTAEVARDVQTSIFAALPLLPAMLFSNGTTVLIQASCASFGEGAVAIFGYASRLHGVLTQILVTGLSTVLLPHLATLWARRNVNDINALFRNLVRISILVALYILTGVYLFGNLAIEFLLARGHFDSAVVAQVQTAWILLSVGIFPFAYGTFIAKLAQAATRPAAILASSGCCFLAVLLATSIAKFWPSFPVLLLSPAFGFAAATSFWMAWYKRQILQSGFLATDMVSAVLRCGIALVPAIAVDIVTRPLTAGFPVWMCLFGRGIVFSLLFAFTIFATGQTRWYFTRPDSQA